MSLLPDRIQPLNDKGVQEGARYVLYWMEQSQRAQHNPALERALHHASETGLPLLVVCGVTDDFPEATLRHHTFLLEGLQETKQRLADRGLKLVVREGAPDDVALAYAGAAAVLVTDRGYLRHQKQWRARVAEEAPCRMEQVEGDVVVPVETVTDKAEYAARTIRPKIHEHLERCLQLPEPVPVETSSLDLDIDSGRSLDDIAAVTDQMDLDRGVGAVSDLYPGGVSEAEAILDDFLAEHLDGYDENRNQIHSHAVSHMSKYLHYGQISPVWLAQQVRRAEGPESDIESYIEELVVRRELTMNHVHFRPDTYDSYTCLPEWARESLAEHADDEREYVYSLNELEVGTTHDPYWNAAMKEMRETGYMHNYMRMYWGKKILEWSPDPKTAYDRTLRLNNRYFLDGRDPNSFANVAWVFGLHDRGWKERPVYGKVRYMSQGGLDRKADPDAYVEKVDRLATVAQSA
ncbi:deoxyribodipyrimidine photo-lyase [Salinibacter ruber]|uniref:deoxyribodipyrimidine photo-lyase n=1 Tax=Salinibacter ruber TaxID=146919 RepID=UPI00216A46F8|nr:deoxyribodipyrimidine photo-lyase [Salinibacter ruber]MCS3666749.1 deoxyribodipyrimidine photo-lyase [Salinibacter ruber]MCS3826232.1 deoxyribodipyrimidine photo-lyase [Salinibacter ruber]MCS4193303.1 deoxyribodipyrimidine photo-lyase [Salinibacter ruber]